MKHISLFLFFATFYLAVLAQKNTTDCSILKKGSFRYLDFADSTARFVIDGSNHTEYHYGGSFYIKSKLKWLSPCKYQMKMVESTYPDFPNKPGDVMIVTIEKIEDDIIYYQSQVGKDKWPGRMKKINQ